MKFCETCGNILIVKSVEDSKFLFCKKCNRSIPLIEEEKVSSSYDESKKEIVVIDESEESEFPITKILCPKCDEIVEAYWAIQQTRGGDEPPTRFYQCKICKYRWREYS